jgi:hypothetical protein
MRRTAVVIVCVAAAAGAGAGEKVQELTFGKADAGKVPSGWAAVRTGPGEGSVWAVTADGTAPSKSGHALAQTAEGPTQLYNLCVVEGSAFRDGEVSALVKAVKGKIDQGGGVMWRFRDANNYYVCRYNPLEKNFRVYHVQGGKRTQLATKEDLALPAGKWFTVSVRHAGDRIECSLDDKKLLEVTDATFPEVGKVGVWSKADAVTHFDRLRYTPAEK